MRTRRLRNRVVFAACGTLAFAAVASAPAARPEDDSGALRDYLSGNGLLNRGLYELAAAEYRSFLADHPEHEKAPVARYGLGVALFRAGDYAEAREALRPLADEAGFSYAAEVATIIGQCHSAAQEYAEAVPWFRRVVERHGKHDLADDAAAGLIEASYRCGEYAAASRDCERYFARYEASAHGDRIRLYWGLALMAQAEHGAAAEHFAALCDRQPASALAPQARLLLAQCRDRVGMLDEAGRLYRKVLEDADAPLLADALFGLGALLVRQGRSEEGGAYLDRFAAEYPEHPQLAAARFHRARAAFDQENYASAAAIFDQVAEQPGPLQDDALFWGAKCRLRQDDPATAASMLAEARSRVPRSDVLAEMTYDEAVALFRAGRPSEALTVIEAFLDQHPRHELTPDALHLRAMAHHRLGDHAASAEACARFLKSAGDHPLAGRVRFLAAENAFLRQDYATAAKGFRSWIQEHPSAEDSDDARYRLGMALYHLEQYGEAAELLAGLLGEGDSGGFPLVRFVLGDIAFERGQWLEAAGYLAAYLGDAPAANGDDALLKLGLALARLDRPAEAAAQFARVLEEHSDSPHRVQAQFELGQARLAMDSLDEATSAFEAVLAADDSRFAPYALSHLAAIDVRLGAPGRAAERLASVEGRSSDEGLLADARLRRGRALFASEEYEDAAEEMEEFLDRHPRHEGAGVAAAIHALCLARLDRHEEALQAVVRARRYGKAVPDDLSRALDYEEAWCLKTLGRKDEAATAFARLAGAAHAADAYGSHALLELAGMAMEAEKYDEAKTHLATLRRSMTDGGGDFSAPMREQVLYRSAVCAFELEEFESCAAFAVHLLRDFPRSEMRMSASYFCGEALVKLGRHREATPHFERIAMQESPSDIEGPALLRLGECHAVLQNWPASEKAFQRYLASHGEEPSWYQAQFGVGYARENQGRHEEAIGAYRDVVNRHQGETAARAQFQIGECLFAQKKYREATAELLKVDILYAYPQWSAAALYEAGRCFEHLGMEVEANRQFATVTEKHGETRWGELAEQRLAQLAQRSTPTP